MKTIIKCPCVQCGWDTNLFLYGKFICPTCYAATVAVFIQDTNKAVQNPQMTLPF